MTEKYILTGKVNFGEQYKITDSEANYAYKNNKSDKQKICDLLNKLTDENEQLKQDRKRLIGYLWKYKSMDMEDIEEYILSRELLDEYGEAIMNE